MNVPDSDTNKKLPSLTLSVLPLVFLVGMLVYVIRTFGTDALSGPSQTALLLTSGFIVALGYFTHHLTYDSFVSAFSEKIGGVAQSIVILLFIGALSGTWMVSGIVPSLIYYGMQVLDPEWFLVTASGICAVISVMTGSSWTTIATIGVAMLGIGKALGFDEGWIAGAIITGAYFGDKISPLSDTTVLASSCTGTPIFTHIRYMLITTIPSFTISLLIFLFAGFFVQHGTEADATIFAEGLTKTFNITPWLFIVPVVTVFMIIRKIPSEAVLFLATLLACVAALIFQQDLLIQLSEATGGTVSQLRSCFSAIFSGASPETGNAELNSLVSTSGMSGMMDTIWLILCAMIFGGAMTASGFLMSITNAFVRLAHSTFSLVTSTVGSGLFINTVCADQYLSIILISSMFGESYRERGYESRLLSRTTEDSVTVTSVLIPWNTCGMTQATVLGVATFTYLPYCFFNYISPVMSMLVAAIGYKIVRRKN